eukprot:2393520-Lingulodinium_polyedra.AAC.1
MQEQAARRSSGPQIAGAQWRYGGWTDMGVRQRFKYVAEQFDFCAYTVQEGTLTNGRQAQR